MVAASRRSLRFVCRVSSSLSAAALVACASGGSALRREAGVAPVAIASDPSAQAALERTCYGCHASGYGLAGRDRLGFSYWFRGSARRAIDFSRWDALSSAERANALAAIAKSVRDGEMPPWDARWLDERGELSAAERDALVRLGS